jgi:serine phosphatase RsbU (regulator of sigma subunit)
MILGAVSDAQFRRASVNFEPGGVLLIYTDGAVERRNGAEEFGLARLAEIVVQHQEESAADILDRIHRAVTLFGDPPAFADDFTLVVIKKV